MAGLGVRDVRFSDETVRKGRPNEILETLKRSVAQYCRVDSDVETMYIGKTSGDNPRTAMKSRYDKYKKENGLDRMIPLYETDKSCDCDEVERKLVKYFKRHEKNINRKRGGGGRHSDRRKFYVYLALKTRPKTPSVGVRWPRLEDIPVEIIIMYLRALRNTPAGHY